jgi:hypothetical protein
MDVSRLRAELTAQTEALGRHRVEAETLKQQLDERLRRASERTDSLDAWRTLELERNAKREDAICKAGQQVPWRTELTCRKGR